MVVNKRIALIIMGFSFYGLSNAQIAQNNNATLNDLAFFINVNNTKYEGVEGSRYLFEEFIPAKINEIQRSYPIRFDIVENNIEFKNNEGEIKGLSTEKDYKIVLLDGTNRVFITKAYLTNEAKLGKTFFERVYASEHFDLFKKERIKFQEAKPAKSSYEPEKPARFIRLPDAFYVSFKHDVAEEAHEIPRKKKKLKEFFGKAYTSIEKFAKKNNLDFEDPSDLVKIINHYIQVQ